MTDIPSQSPSPVDEADEVSAAALQAVLDEQDPDTLDTWFSSALWTWSTLVDPEAAADFTLSLEEILESSPDFQKFQSSIFSSLFGVRNISWYTRLLAPRVLLISGTFAGM